jgi:hypothetical protein
MNTLKPKCLRSALYARNPLSISIQDRLDTVHKARYVGTCVKTQMPTFRKTKVPTFRALCAESTFNLDSKSSGYRA